VSPDDLARRLRRERDRLRTELAELTSAPRDPLATVSFGKRVGDGTTQAVERIAQVSVARSLDAKLRQVERALAKVEEGTHGICDVCGRRIDPERIAAFPWSTRCVTCAARHESVMD